MSITNNPHNYDKSSTPNSQSASWRPSSARLTRGWAALDDGRKRGLCIVPGKPGTKVPLVKWKEYQERHPSEAEIRQWRHEFVNINPIMVTGSISKLVVVDCDGLLGCITIKKRGILSETVTVRTPRGDFHEHYWFKHPTELGRVPCCADGYDHDLLSIDLRGDGGIAVYPGGTNVAGRLYSFKEGYGPDDIEIAPLPDWLYEYIAKHNHKLAAQEAERCERLAEAERVAQLMQSSPRLRIGEQAHENSYQARMQRYAAAARRNQIAKVEAATCGGRNQQLFKSAAALAEFVNEGVWSEADIEADLTRAAIVCGLDRDPNCGPSGIRATIRSGIRKGRSNRVVLAERRTLPPTGRPKGEA